MVNVVKFLSRFYCFVNVVGTVVRISERKVKRHLGGSGFEICNPITLGKARAKNNLPIAYIFYQTLDCLIVANCLGARNYKSHEIRKIISKQIEYHSGLAYSFLRESESLW